MYVEMLHGINRYPAQMNDHGRTVTISNRMKGISSQALFVGNLKKGIAIASDRGAWVSNAVRKNIVIEGRVAHLLRVALCRSSQPESGRGRKNVASTIHSDDTLVRFSLEGSVPRRRAAEAARHARRATR